MITKYSKVVKKITDMVCNGMGNNAREFIKEAKNSGIISEKQYNYLFIQINNQENMLGMRLYLS